MVGKQVLCLVAMCIVATAGFEPPNPALFQACKAELKLGDDKDMSKMPCVMACMGKKEGWLTNESTIDMVKSAAWAAQSPFSPIDREKMNAASEACKNEAKGLTDYCDIGNKLVQCMKAKGAPFPPHP